MRKNTRANLKNSGLNTIKKIFFSIIPVCLLVSSMTTAQVSNFDEIKLNDDTPVQYKQSEIKNTNGVLRGGVSVTQDLPKEFYGTWSVVSTLEETNNPELFRMRSSDIWTFNRTVDIITLSNPVSGASASITVTEVNNKTAIFTREQRDENIYEIEKAEITVEGDSFSGTDLIIIKHYRNGKRVKTDKVKYKVRGYKVSGPTLKDIFAR